jgi:hypothetical protein
MESEPLKCLKCGRLNEKNLNKRMRSFDNQQDNLGSDFLFDEITRCIQEEKDSYKSKLKIKFIFNLKEAKSGSLN